MTRTLKPLLIAAFALSAANAAAQKFEGLAQTPPMGWSSWNKFGCEINEDIIKQTADLMVSTGLRDAGYIYLNIDDCWQGERDSLGFIQLDSVTFPSGMKPVGDYIHERGLKFGIYSDAGRATCAKRVSSLGHEYQDAMSYASWGVDFLKYDWCFAENINPMGAYMLMRDALYAAGRPIVFSMCEWGSNRPWEWAQNIGHMWRTTGDIENCFDCTDDHGGTWTSLGVMPIVYQNLPLRQYSGPGHWNDPDMMQVGNGMPVNEERAHFSMWCMLAAPLILGNDLSNMNEGTLSVILNTEAIAVDQDPLGVQGLRHSDVDGIQFWFKPLLNDEWALCILNSTTEERQIVLDWQEFNFTDDLSDMSTGFDSTVYKVRDLWAHRNDGNTRKSRKLTMPGHDVVMYRLTPSGK